MSCIYTRLRRGPGRHPPCLAPSIMYRTCAAMTYRARRCYSSLKHCGCGGMPFALIDIAKRTHRVKGANLGISMRHTLRARLHRRAALRSQGVPRRPCRGRAGRRESGSMKSGPHGEARQKRKRPRMTRVHWQPAALRTLYPGKAVALPRCASCEVPEAGTQKSAYRNDARRDTNHPSGCVAMACPDEFTTHLLLWKCNTASAVRTGFGG